MATMYIQLYTKLDNALIYNIKVVGKKMPWSWVEKNYGKDCGVIEMYKTHKNPYGIEWVTIKATRYGTTLWEYSDDPAKAERPIKQNPFGYRVQGYINY